MPKTGSQTVEASLQHCSLPDRIVRCHFLSSGKLAELRQKLCRQEGSECWRQQTRQQVEQVSKLVWVIRLRNLLRSCKINIPKLQIITAVREPIGLGLSSVFQNYLYFAPGLESLTLDLCSEILQRPRMLKSLEAWFDLELKPITGLDVYQTPFPREQGYAIYENSRARVLLYRFDALKGLQNMLQTFLACNPPALVSRNLGHDKPYGRQYEYAKRHLRLPAEFVRAHYRTKLAQHFYSSQELSALVQRWTSADSRQSLPDQIIEPAK